MGMGCTWDDAAADDLGVSAARPSLGSIVPKLDQVSVCGCGAFRARVCVGQYMCSQPPTGASQCGGSSQRVEAARVSATIGEMAVCWWGAAGCLPATLASELLVFSSCGRPKQLPWVAVVQL